MATQKSVKEIKAYHEKNDMLKEKFAAVRGALQLVDLTKNDSRTFTTFSKETLRSYMRNPMANSNNLRQLSNFLYRVCYPYRRIIHYNAEMVDLKAQSIIPMLESYNKKNVSKTLKNYFETLTKVEQINLASEIFKLLVIAWREDTVYGYIYDDDDTFFIHILDGQYCKISSTDGVFNFAYDFSYFRNNTDDLEYWGPEFQQKYTAYQNDNTLRWQELEPEYTICLKVNLEDPILSLPPFVALFEQIIDLVDLQSLQAVKDELSIYKLLVARMETLSNTDEPDDFSVDIDTAIEYYNKFADSLPDYVTSCISPLPIDAIEFKGTTTDDVDMISNSMSNLFQNSGGAQILNSSLISGSTAFEAAIQCDTEMALSSLLPQIEKWMNRYLTYKIGDDHAIVRYMKVSPYTRAKKKKELLESAQNGVPVKLALAALDGFTPLETLSMEFLENECLGLHETWIPLQTSYTQSGAGDTDPITGGAPTKDGLTDEGDATRDGEKNKK